MINKWRLHPEDSERTEEAKGRKASEKEHNEIPEVDGHEC